jgi:hypothetical protein
MKVILTWSGSASHDIASFFRTWLTSVLPAINPWISDQDIAKGKEWFKELMSELTESSVSMTFITSENLRSPWVYYEAGVIAAKLEDCMICPYLIGVEAVHVRDTPLGEYQCTMATKEDTFRLVRSINQTLEDSAHNDQLLEANFNARWPELNQRLNLVLDGLMPVYDNVVEVEPPIEQQLSEEARTILTEASQDPEGQIIFITQTIGTCLQTNGKNLIDEDTPRGRARWRAAMDELFYSSLLERTGDVYELTKKGFEIADRLRSRS